MKSVFSWAPLFIFFSIISYLLITKFRNDVDEYFVRIVLKACLMLISACAISQLFVFALLALGKAFSNVLRPITILKEFFDFLSAFPVIEIGIFSIGIFFTAPAFFDWVWILSGLMVLETFQYWLRFSKSSLRHLFAFARFHQIDFYRTHKVLGPYLMGAFIKYFFLSLKRTLLPLVFILVVMDFRIILPRLVEAGLSLQAFALLMSLMISLHLLSYREEF